MRPITYIPLRVLHMAYSSTPYIFQLRTRVYTLYADGSCLRCGVASTNALAVTELADGWRITCVDIGK